MRFVRKAMLYLMPALLLVAVVPFAYAQSDETQAYENNLFSVEVPSSLTVQAEGSNFVTFSADDVELNVQLLRPAQSVIDALGDNAAETLLDIMRFVFFDTDYVAKACPATVEYPCVTFSDVTDSAVFQRALVHDGGSNVFYALTFQAPTQAELDAMNPGAVLDSFRLAGATTATEAARADDREAMFNAVVSGNVNLRSCASTNCAIVGQALNGQVVPVVAQDGNWYEIKWENGTAFIASWLTTRGPDVHVDLTEGYFDRTTGCGLVLRKNRGDTDLYFAISGDRQDDVWVDLYRVNENKPLDVAGQYVKEFIDTKEIYIHQSYYWGTWWPSGVYRIELTLDGESSMIGFDFESGAEHIIYVHCE
jgi:uncharacterized protein YraI